MLAPRHRLFFYNAKATIPKSTGRSYYIQNFPTITVFMGFAGLSDMFYYDGWQSDSESYGYGDIYGGNSDFDDDEGVEIQFTVASRYWWSSQWDRGWANVYQQNLAVTNKAPRSYDPVRLTSLGKAVCWG